MARRFFVEDIRPDRPYAEIRGEELRHLKGALRLSAGRNVVLFNGSGLEFEGTIESIGRDAARVRINGSRLCRSESRLGITLLQGLIKGDRPELVVQKATELGVSGIVFFTASRTVPRPDAQGLLRKLQRLKRVAVEAAKQSGRCVLPRIDLTGFTEALRLRDWELKVVFYEGEGVAGLRGVLGQGRRPRSVAALVGPEGGFTEAEVEEAQGEGFRPVGLGPRILRAETAAISVVSILQYELGDMG